MILVTGGAGFIGANFVIEWLARNNEPVLNLDLLTYAGNLENLRSILEDPRHLFVRGDICDGALLENLLQAHRPRAIVHFAAESHVDRSIARPDEFLRTNIFGTHSLLRAALTHWRNMPPGDRDRFRFLHVSTDEVFGSLESKDPPFTESSQYQPNSPYSASKGASDHFVRAWNRTYGLPTLITHCSNNYGPFQMPEKLIPLTIHHALAGLPIPIYGNGGNVRDWIYVCDHCAALRRVLESGSSGTSFNIGGDAEISNLELVRAICTMMDNAQRCPTGGSYHDLIRFVPDRPGHDQRYGIDSSRVRAELGWQPDETLASGLTKTVGWYLANREWLRHAADENYHDWLHSQYGQTACG